MGSSRSLSQLLCACLDVLIRRNFNRIGTSAGELQREEIGDIRVLALRYHSSFHGLELVVRLDTHPREEACQRTSADPGVSCS